MGATEPLLGTRVVGPTVVIPGSGGGPSHGARTRASTPKPRSARASPSTCAWTPPNNDNEYGQDSMTRIPRARFTTSLMRPKSSHRNRFRAHWDHHSASWVAAGASGWARHG